MRRPGRVHYQPANHRPIDHKFVDHKSVNYVSRNHYHRRINYVDDDGRTRVGAGCCQSLRVDGVVVGGGLGGAGDPR